MTYDYAHLPSPTPPDTFVARHGIPSPGLAAKLGLFDATMVVMGGIVGAGIFINPYVVAREVHTPALILGVWALGGLLALGGAFIYAELAARLPAVGGQYAYLRDAFHPALAFLYGWVLLLVIQTGGMAAVAVTFARYFLQVTHLRIGDAGIAAAALALLSIINCLGVRPGSAVQSTLMVLKIVAILALVAAGLWFILRSPVGAGAAGSLAGPLLDRPVSAGLLAAIGGAMVPVLFSYGGWQTSNFIAAEIREPQKNLPRALLLGVAGVIVLYLAVNFACVAVLGPEALAAAGTPASSVMRAALGTRGAQFIALGIMISALGFLSQSILTAPRVYFAMADDGLFFRAVAWLHPRSRVPVVAILLQAACAMVIVMIGKYEQILSYVVSMDFLFFGLTALSLFVFRRGHPRSSGLPSFRVPGHPVTTVLFIVASWAVVLNTFFRFPRNSTIGWAILLAGLPVYFLWKGHQRRRGS